MTSLLGLGRSKQFFKFGLGLHSGLRLGLGLLQLLVYVEGGATLGFAQSPLLGQLALPCLACPTFIIHRLLLTLNPNPRVTCDLDVPLTTTHTVRIECEQWKEDD